MKKLMLTVCLVLGLLIMAAPALADNFAIGDHITFSLPDPVSADGYGSGGLFIITDKSGGASIQTFCLELTEHIHNDDYVGSISGSAVKGGLGGGNPDAISSATGWLYAQFLAGPALYNTKALQIAFWILEQEVAYNDPDHWFDAGLLTTAQGYVDAANLNAIPDNYYGTQVLNLQYYADGSDAQSQLINVPEPGILILLGIAMSAIGAASWRLRKL